ncbi:MAG: D-alanyl-D-alanine carboxypeptidase [Actinomycetota bacterium]
MTSYRHGVRALALSLALCAAGALSVAEHSLASEAAVDPVGGSIGGRQLGAAGVIVNLHPGVPAPPAMPGASFVLADMDTGQILVAKAPHAPHLPASTIKALTALTLIPVLNPNAKILVKDQDVNVDGTRLGILPGTSYSVATLLRGMLMASGNDAAYALARADHDIATTLMAMNATAKDLGALDTVAKDPSGLDRTGQRTSAYDLALIGRAAMRLPDFRRYVRTKSATLPGGRSADGTMKPGFTISNHNLLLYNYPGTIGIKNGYTIAAGHTYIEAATRGGKTYLVSEMAANEASWRPTAALLDWAFAHGSAVTPIGRLVEPGEAAASKATVDQVAKTAAVAVPAGPSTTRQIRSAGQPELQAWIGAAVAIGAVSLTGAWARRRKGRQVPLAGSAPAETGDQT